MNAPRGIRSACEIKRGEERGDCFENDYKLMNF